MAHKTFSIGDINIEKNDLDILNGGLFTAAVEAKSDIIFCRHRRVMWATSGSCMEGK